jgi:plasmid stabilization system protein ParE
MAGVIWTPQALADVQRLYRFLAARNPRAASHAVAAIRAGAAHLANHPEIGRTIDGFGEAYREWLIDFGSAGYALLYRIDGPAAVILAIRHQREAGY